MPEALKYTGKVQPHCGEIDEKGQPLFPYLPSDELVEAVNLAIYLERPLLIRGEPGCGKTKLARAVAYQLKLPYESWSVKSTSRAQDGLYVYDAVKRLHDAQLVKLRDDKEIAQKVDKPEEYITWGPLGKAFRNEKRTVVLIDEIDKADIDFPNDLLLELDEKRFTVKELKDREIRAEKDKIPIVFITSNDEKDLPDAFLRRCIFHYIEFPKKERLIEITKAHFPDSDETLIDGIIEYFTELRNKMRHDQQDQRRKKASTSELLDWFKALRHKHPDNEILGKLSEKFLYPGVLIKNWEDYQRYLPSEDKS